MNKIQTNSGEAGKPRRLGRGLSALLGEPVAVQAAPPAGTGTGTGYVEPKAPIVPVTDPFAVGTAGSGGAGSRGLGKGLGGDSNRGAQELPSVTRATLETGVGSVGSGGGSGGDGLVRDRVVRVPIESIEPSPYQPRRTFDETQLRELADSIKSAGVVQPVLLRERGGSRSGQYELIAGERRWRASKLAGIAFVPAVISELSDEQAAEWALIENVQRADLSPMERAWAIKGLCDRFQLTHAQVAEKIGIDRSSATNLVRLTELELEIRDLLETQQLTGGHGKALLSAPAGVVRVSLAKIAAAQGWSVRRLEQAAARAAESPQGAAPDVRISEPALSKAAALKDLEKQLSDHLGTNVKIRANAGGKRGSLVIKFYDLDHFDGLMSKIGFVLK